MLNWSRSNSLLCLLFCLLTLTVNLSTQAQDCLQGFTFTANPLPNGNNAYTAGQTVQFCFTVIAWQIPATSNQIHGVVPSFGSGWDLSTLVPFPAAVCNGSNQGFWNWYASVTSTATGNSFGPGFFYEDNTFDSDPGNNFGDGCSGNPNLINPLQFCWNITVKACPSSAERDLDIDVETYADGESGAWITPDCQNDPVFNFTAAVDPALPSETVNASVCEGRPYNGAVYTADTTVTDTISGVGGCDSVIITNIDYNENKMTFIDTSICRGGTYNGITFNNSTNIIRFLQSAAGCDSILDVDIFVIDPPTVLIDTTICIGGTYAGQLIIADTTITRSFPDPCGDSTVITSVTASPSYNNTIDTSICSGDRYNGVTYTANESFRDTFATASGCDSIVNVNITVSPAQVVVIDTAICDNQSYDGVNYTSNTTLRDTATGTNGCDSITEVNITVNPTRFTDIDTMLCEGDTYNGIPFNQSTNFIRFLSTERGCDSIVEVDIVIIELPSTTLDTVMCEGDIYAGVFITEDTSIVRALPSQCGDSTVTTNVTMNPRDTSIIDTSICNGDFYDGTQYFASDTAVRNFTNTNGCDSTVITHLNVVDEPFVEIDTGICLGEVFRSKTINGDTIFAVFDFSATGCDSLTQYNVQALQASTRQIDTAFCPGSSFFGATYFRDTTLTINSTAANGCDSTTTVNISMLQQSSSSADSNVCRGELVRGFVITADTTFNDTLVNAAGCDSIANLNILIQEPSSSTIDTSVCPGDQFAGRTINNDTIFFDTLSNAAGCDSMVQTNVTLYSSPVENTQVGICFGDSVFLAGEFRRTPGIYNDTFNTSNNCDSVVITELLVDSLIRTHGQETVCRGECVDIHGIRRCLANSYVDTFQAQNGCDSISTIELIVNEHSATSRDIQICQSDSFFAGGSFQNTDGTYTDTLNAANGCDSVVTTNLAVNPEYDIAIDSSICQGGTFLGSTINNDTSFVRTFSSADNCDSIVTHNIVALLPAQGITDTSFCSGGSFRGIVYTSDSTLRDTLIANNGCDSLDRINITILNPSTRQIDSSFCEGGSFLGQTYESDTSFTINETGANGCDSTVNVNLTVFQTDSNIVAVGTCQGDSVFVGGAWQTSSGQYTDVYSNSNGCDSTVITNLTVVQTISTNASAEICQGDTLFVGGAQQTTPGTYFDTLQAVGGCDSVITTTLTIDSGAQTQNAASICRGDSLFVGGGQQTQAGTYSDTLQTANGCDSIVTTVLTVTDPVAASSDTSICRNSTYRGLIISADTSLSDTLTAASGCDSIHQTNVFAIDASQHQIDTSVCNGSSYNGRIYNSDTTFNDTTIGANGCDSITTTNIAVLPTHSTFENVGICSGDSIFLGGAWRDSSGVFVDSLLNSDNCDSVVTTTLTVVQTIITNEQFVICQGDSANIQGEFESVEATYFDTLRAIGGCDSVIITFLDVDSGSTQTVNQSICAGDTFIVAGRPQTSSGLYPDTLTNRNGCDSIIVTDLTVIQPLRTNSDTSICEGEPFRNTTVMADTLVHDTLTGSNGCDSIHSTQLFVIFAPVTLIDTSICFGETFLGQSYTADTVLTDTLIAVNGCDSFSSVNLVVLSTDTTNNQMQICQGDSAFLGGQNQTAAGTYTDVYSNASGCDSVVITDLTVVQTILTNLQERICEGDSFFVQSAQQTNAGTYFDTLASSGGCDSVVIIELFVDTVSRTVLNPEICEGDSLFAGGANQTQSGTYFDTLQNATGCDSIIETQLVVHPTTFSTVDTSICEGELYNGAAYSTDTTLIDTLVNAEGCDSIRTTNLSFILLQRVTVDTSLCEGDQFRGTAYFSDSSYSDTLAASTGCDSFTTYNITVIFVDTTTRQLTICQGDSVLLEGAFRTIDGRFTDVLTASTGCDSILITDLTVVQTIVTPLSATICRGDSIQFAGNSLFIEGVYTDTLLSAGNCDSVVILSLEVDSGSTDTSIATICQGDSFFAAGSFRSTDGFYSDTLTNQNGCDSILVTDLRVIPTQFTTIDTAICEGSIYRGHTIAADTTLIDSLTGNIGCDSIVTTNITNIAPLFSTQDTSVCIGESINGVTILSDTSFIDTLQAQSTGCDSFASLNITTLLHAANTLNFTFCEGDTFNGLILTTDTSLIDTLTATNGCDSILTTVLDVNPSTFFVIDTTFCEGAGFEGNNYQNDTVLVDTLVNNNGCDSIRTVNITTVAPAITLLNHTLCEGDVFGGTVLSSDTIITDTLSSAIGCDSFVVNSITVNPDSFETITLTICAGEQVLGTRPSQDTLFNETLISGTGCDLFRETQVTVLPTFASLAQVNLCEGQSIFVGGANQTQSGTYTDTLSAANGCDSIVTTELTVFEIAEANFVWTPVCLGTPMEFTNLTQEGDAPIATYTWLFGDNSFDNVPSPLHQYADSGIYAVSLIAEDLNGCIDTFVTNVQVDFQPVMQILQNDTQICAGTFITLNVTGADSISWAPDFWILSDSISGTLVTRPEGSITYVATGVNGVCPPVSVSVTIDVVPTGSVNAEASPETIVLGSSTHLDGSFSSLIDSLIWSPADGLTCTNCADPIAFPTETTTYTLTGFSSVADSLTCVVTDSITIEVIDGCDGALIFIPNSFTPNGDGQNDYFLARGNGLNEIQSFRVFDRWGKLIFENNGVQANDPLMGWDGFNMDGNQAGSGVYVYLMELVCANGDVLEQQGTINLLR